MPTEEQIKNHFENIYDANKKEWGADYSKSAVYFAEFLKNSEIHEIHLVAAGYGRHIKPFLKDLEVVASDYTTNGVEQLNNIDGVRAYKYDVMEKSNKTYDAIYSYSLLHMFKEIDERALIVKNLSDMLKIDGYMMLVNMSQDIKFTSSRTINYISIEEINNYCTTNNLTLIEHKKFTDTLMNLKNLDGDFIVEAYILQKNN